MFIAALFVILQAQIVKDREAWSVAVHGVAKIRHDLRD